MRSLLIFFCFCFSVSLFAVDCEKDYLKIKTYLNESKESEKLLDFFDEEKPVRKGFKNQGPVPFQYKSHTIPEGPGQNFLQNFSCRPMLKQYHYPEVNLKCISDETDYLTMALKMLIEENHRERERIMSMASFSQEIEGEAIKLFRIIRSMIKNDINTGSFTSLRKKYYRYQLLSYSRVSFNCYSLLGHQAEYMTQINKSIENLIPEIDKRGDLLTSAYGIDDHDFYNLYDMFKNSEENESFIKEQVSSVVGRFESLRVEYAQIVRFLNHSYVEKKAFNLE